MQVILAAGGVVRRGSNDDRIAVVYRQRHNDWSLPKGKLETGERFEEAAVREVHEEIGCRAEIHEFIAAVDYRVKRGPKVVFFYDMEVTVRRKFVSSDEIQDLKWLPLKDAARRLTYDLEREVVDRYRRLRERR